MSGWRISPAFVDNRRHPCRGGVADVSPVAVPGAVSFAAAGAPVDGAGAEGAGSLPGAFPYEERSSGGFGVSAADSSFTASSIPLRTSSDAFLNSAIPLPRLLAKSGRRFGPKKIRRPATRMIEHLLEADTEHFAPLSVFLDVLL